MSTLSARAEAILKEAMSLTSSEQAEVANRLFAALVQSDNESPVPDWHQAILNQRLAEPDDDDHTCSLQEARSKVAVTIRRAKAHE
jgi:hypothetical protein